MWFKIVLTLIFVFFYKSQVVFAQPNELGDKLMSLQQQAELQDSWLKARVEGLLPEMMKQHNIDMWLIMSREYNEDPILKTLLPASWMNARRRTILLFSLHPTRGFEAFAMAKYDIGEVYKKAWDPEQEPEQLKALSQLITELDPKRIGVNQSIKIALADGLVATDKDLLLAYLPISLHQRLVSAQPLAIDWLQTRSQEEIEQYKHLVALTKAIVNEGLSNVAIRPRKTQIKDLIWWFRERASSLGLSTWFQPSVRVQRQRKGVGVSDDPNVIILPGDLLHVDFGLEYLGLHSDIQQHAYVLKAGESKAPDFITQGLRQANQLQDMLLGNFKAGRSGNEILSRTREQALLANLRPQIYSHPIGYYGHSAGTVIGLWDAQYGVPGSGDLPLRNNTAYAIELNVSMFSEQWQKDITFMLEENAIFFRNKIDYMAPRQKHILLIKHKQY
ncbi:M24 family metallopeptidase [Thalassotalea aquiviva]|uniref:M24 family metallopeptidase n=1 Tax=Thalassotalea aquiviva TaxID=3242415 RepID=UPI00352B6353